MIICLVIEGSYPYITGGVASWVHQLISGLPEFQFKIISIMPTRSEKLNLRYESPSNLIEIKTLFLDDYLNSPKKLRKKKLYLSEEEKEQLKKFIELDPEVNWEMLFKVLSARKVGTPTEFLESRTFWDLIVDYYEKNYGDSVFNTFFWTERNMLLPLIHLLQQETLQADIYHAVSTGYAGILGVALKHWYNKPLILTEHGIYAREREEDILKAKWVTGIYKKLWIRFFYFISTAPYKSADKIVTLFQKNSEIQISLGAPREKTVVIPNGVDNSKYNIIYKEHDGYNIGSIVRVTPIKDVMTLIRAFKIVKENMEGVKLYIIGPTDEDPDYYSDCVNLVKMLNMENDIVFTGRVNVLDYLSILDVLVLTSISEAQPLVILEGMSVGLPFVATDVGGCKELLDRNEYEGVCGLVGNLVSPNDTALNIMRILMDPKKSQEMSENGKKRARRAFGQNNLLDRYEDLYNEVWETWQE